MSAEQVIAMTVAVLVLISGGAAVGAGMPADAANDTAVTVTEDVLPEQGEVAHPEENASELQEDNAESVGPSDGMPDRVPDRVGEIHDRIDGFLNGAFGNLGEVLAQFLGNGHAG